MSGRRPAVLGLALVLALFLPSCEFVNPTAPEDGSISISANPTFIDIGGEAATITVIISEADGSPVPDDTIVNFTTTLGTIPNRGLTRSGLVQVPLTSGSQPGVATVTARAGTTSNEVSIEVVVGAILESLVLSADPSALGPDGGTSNLTAVAFGDDGEPLANVPVVFSSDSGSLASGGAVVRTDARGEATDTLTTEETATVTATSGSTTANATVQVTTNEPPRAQFVFSPANPTIGQDVTFNAGGSTDDESIVSYEWDFGDGDTDTGQRTSHAFATPNTFTVLLVVTDDDGVTASASRNVTVSTGDAPVASFTFTPPSPQAGQTVQFNAASSFDPDGDIVEYRWDWGDGTAPEIRPGPTVAHSFGTTGTFTVTLTVRDDSGNVATATQIVVVS